MILQDKANAILAALPAAGVPDDVIVGAGTCPTTGLPAFLQSLVTLLTSCIPAAKTPAGFQKVANNPDLGVRLELSRQLRQSIIQNYGDDEDGRQAMTTLFQPMKSVMLAQMKALTLEDATQILAEQPSSV